MIQVEKDENGIDVFVGGMRACNEQEDTFNDGIVQDVQKAFAEHGFNVTSAAIWHNFYAWNTDYKSGYRDDENGYFLFSPCGCNQLRFHVEALNGKDYQLTYEC